jgi:hypothetical protein
LRLWRVGLDASSGRGRLGSWPWLGCRVAAPARKQTAEKSHQAHVSISPKKTGCSEHNANRLPKLGIRRGRGGATSGMVLSLAPVTTTPWKAPRCAMRRTEPTGSIPPWEASGPIAIRARRRIAKLSGTTLLAASSSPKLSSRLASQMRARSQRAVTPFSSWPLQHRRVPTLRRAR